MLPTNNGLWGGARRRPQSFVHAVRVLRGQGHADPVVLGYTPAFRNNPYQDLLYRGLWSTGVAPVPIASAAAVSDLAIATRLGVRTVLHVHWTAQLSTADRSETLAAHADFRRDVEELLAGGTRLVWTVHNRMPHECMHEDLEIDLRRWLVDRADVIHVMGAATAEAVADLYPLPPEKVVEVPHPSYEGVYPSTLDRDAARWELGVSPDEEVLLLFGGIRPYKNVDLALDALDELLAAGRRARLVVAGQIMGRWTGKAELEHRIVRHPATLAHLGRIDEYDVQRYFLAADALLLPYASIVNSGVLLLGATFGLPVVGPDMGEVGEVVRSSGAGATFPAGAGPAEFAATVADLLDGALDEARAGAAAYAAGLHPETVAATYRSLVVDRLGPLPSGV